MLQHRSIIQSADNSGAKKLMVIRVLGGYKKRYARIGDIITCAVKAALPRSTVKKSDVVHCVVVRTKKEFKRKSGMYIRFMKMRRLLLIKKLKNQKEQEFLGRSRANCAILDIKK